MKKIIISISIIYSGFLALGQSNIDKNLTENNSVTNQLLQGKWQAVDDKKNFLVFDKNERKETGDGSNWDSEKYVLSNKCVNESDKENGIEPEKDKYISCVESDLCWYIVSINKDFLTLSYMGRGNLLNYKRVK
jgi:hypothetical protein